MMDALCCNALYSESIALFYRCYENELCLDVQCFVIACRAFAKATALHFGGKCAVLSECKCITDALPTLCGDW